MANCIPCGIKDLTLNKKSIYIIGLIIAKSEKKSFISQANGTTKAVFTITLRDTKEHFINCSIWGTENYIDNCVQAYRIGDIIAVNKPSVIQKNNDNQYVPKTTSPFALQFSEGKGLLYRESAEGFPPINQLRNQTIKPTSLALNLIDLTSLPETQRTLVDLICIVQCIDVAQFIQTKNGSKIKRRILLMDSTTHSIQLDIWLNEYQQCADQWRPMETILHLVDIRLEYSKYDRTHILNMDSRTIIIENPIQSSRANSLAQYLRCLTPDQYTQFKDVQPKVNPIDSINIAEINDVMTTERIRRSVEEGTENDFAVKIYGVITKFDINPKYDRGPIMRSCRYCQRYLAKNQVCDNVYCVPQLGYGAMDFVEKFFISFHLRDHKGAILNCRINDEYASTLFGCTANEFKQLSETKIEEIEEMFFMKRFAIKMIVKPKSSTDFVANVLSIDGEDPEMMAKQMKIY